jgi:tetratricopeptide (TPR) repeat protein
MENKTIEEIELLLNNANNLYEQQKYSDSINLLVQIYELIKIHLSNFDTGTANILQKLAKLYKLMGRYEDAVPLYQKSLEIIEHILGSNHRYTAYSLNNLGLLYKLMGRYEDAENLYKRSLKIIKNSLGINHPDTVTSLNNLGGLYELMGRTKNALSLYKKALKIRKYILDINHPDTANSLNNLGLLYESMGRYEDAEPQYKQALEIREDILGIDHPDTATSLNNLGLLYKLMGRYQDAVPLIEKALKIRKYILGINHPDTATSLNNLGLLYESMGRFEDTLLLYERALEISKTVLGLNHRDTATSLNNLGSLYKSMGRYEDAEPRYKQALEILKNILGIKDRYTAISLNNLGTLYLSMGRYEDAEPLYQEALEILKNILGINHPDTITFLHNLGVLYSLMGRYKDAENLYQQTLENLENILGINHPDTATFLYDIGILYSSMGDYEYAYKFMKQYFDIELNLISQIFKLSNEAQRLNYLYLDEKYYNFEAFISLIFQYLANSSKPIQAAFELIQKRKLIVTETTILQKNTLLSGRYPQLNTLFKEYQEKTQIIINLTFQNLTEAQQSNRNQLIQEQQKIEEELSRQIPELNIEQNLLKIDRGAVASKLPKDSTLLEFVRFNVFDFKAIPANGDTQWKPARYLAFILPARQPDQVQMIDLGEADNIDRLIKVFRENIILGKSDGFDRTILKMKTQEELDKIQANPELNEVFQNKQQLKQLLFDPIQKCLTAGTQKLIIAPDGELNLLPFELLPVNNHQYLMDEYTISYVNVGRDIIRLKLPSTTQPTEPLIIANPDYNLNDENAVTSQDTPTQTQRSIDTVYSDLHKSQPDGMFAPIPGTGLESVEISRYLGVTPQTEKNALESLVKSQLSPRILHIATHGYFLTIENLKPLKDTPFSQLDSLHRAGMQNVQNPLLRAGLAFAGANTALNGGRLPAAAEDGILTAQDVATFLDLSATKLVVLSACESGLGEVKLGESVHGLRHAFLQTGAKSLIVSLWAVSDISTAILMGQFYHYYLEKKKPVGEALELAKRYVCNLTVGEMRDTWLTDEKIEYVGQYTVESQEKLKKLCDKSDDYKPYRHPKYWGAFIYLGLAD